MKKRVNIGLKKDVHTRAKVIAVIKGITLNEYLVGLVEKAVEGDKKLLERLK